MINAANSDNAFIVHALFDGLKGSGKTLIQTSGSSVVGTYDNGEKSDDTFDEDTPFTPQPEKAMRVAIDNQVLAAAKDGLRTIVIRPTLIYGRGLGVPGISVQLPKLIDVAKKHGVPRHVGRGLNIWGHVHIADVVELFLLALDKAKPGSTFYAESWRSKLQIGHAVDRPHAGPGRHDEGLADRRSRRGAWAGRVSELRLEQPRARETIARAWVDAEAGHAVR